MMSASLLLWLTLATGVFWMVGVYNRLMRMRARGLDAFGSVEKQLWYFVELVNNHLGASEVIGVEKDYLPSEWLQLLKTLDKLEQALKEAKRMPLSVQPIANLAEVLLGLQRDWLQLKNVPTDLAGPVVPHSMELQWNLIAERVAIARSGFNQILIKYNQAIAQFPARVVVRYLGFKAAGLL